MEMEGDRIQGSPSYYSVLGVSSDSSIEEIRRAYRKLAMVSKAISKLIKYHIFSVFSKLYKYIESDAGVITLARAMHTSSNPQVQPT